MNKLLLPTFFSVFFLFGSLNSFAWGPIGHYTIGQLAEWQMRPSTLEKVNQVLENESIAAVGTWMDQIRSDTAYDYTRTWHWITTVDGIYDPSIQEETGDAFSAFLTLKENLKSGKLSPKEERDQLRMLIHIVGDLHQPLHVGQPGDRGGNDVPVTFFNRQTNLHAVWDYHLIENRRMSYSELAAELNRRITPELVKEYESARPADWLVEAAELRPYIYDIPDNAEIRYQYIYKHYHIVEERILAAGIRLAKILEDIYG
ncbi:MAG: S1/P1 Nuclease [Saprospirales bacterium]|nr:MAG: S1/P1 Nuclease [Saprospirales bacterium]